jgi:hypothetical protein
MIFKINCANEFYDYGMQLKSILVIIKKKCIIALYE